jgi:TP901 family phage tail tape measure protein
MSSTNIDLGVFVRLFDKLTAPMKKLEGDVGASSKRMNKSLNMQVKLLGGGAAAAGVAAMSKGIINSALEPIKALEKAKGELASLGVQNLKIVTDMGKKMQGEYAGINADAFTRAAYDIKSGVSSLTDQGVADMTRAAMVVAKATRGVPEEMTSLFATGYGIFKKQYAGMKDADFANVFGDMIAKSVQVFKTDGAKMQAAIESAGAAATNYGMKMSGQFAVLGRLQAVMSGAEAGTALRAFAMKAGEANDNFAKLAKTTANPVVVRVLDENNQLRAMPDILADVKARYGETLDAMEGAELSKALGSEEAVKVIQGLWDQEEALRAEAAALEQASKSGGKFAASMAKLTDNNFDAQLTKMNQKWELMKMTLGEKMIPVLEKIMPYVESAMNKFTAWADANPKLAGSIATAIVVIGALAAVLAPILIIAAAMAPAFGMIGTAFGAMGISATVAATGPTKFQSVITRLGGFIGRLVGTLFGLARNALPIVGRALMVIGRLLIANPIGIAIMAIAGAAYLIYTYWDRLEPHFVKIWNGIKTVFWGFVTVLKAVLFTFTPAGLIYKHWDGISTWFAARWESVKSVFSTLFDWAVSAFLNFTPLGLIYTHWDGISAWFAARWEGVKSGFATVCRWIKSAAEGNFNPANIIYAKWGAITAWFSGMWGRVRGVFVSGWAGIKATTSGWAGSMRSVGSGIINALAAGIRAAPGAVWNALSSVVTGGINRIRAMVGLGGMGGATTPPRIGVPKIAGARALGGPVMMGKTYLVGERGPELFTAPFAGQIIANDNIGSAYPSGLPSIGRALSSIKDGPKNGGDALSFAPVYNVTVTAATGASASDIQNTREMMRDLMREMAQEAAADMRRRLHD